MTVAFPRDPVVGPATRGPGPVRFAVWAMTPIEATRATRADVKVRKRMFAVLSGKRCVVGERSG